MGTDFIWQFDAFDFSVRRADRTVVAATEDPTEGRIIAAAPDLLEALKAINDAAPDMPDALWRQVDAAIAKAEGRTP